MYLDSLKIQNFRCYEDSDFKFNRKFNLIIGKNGSGKTSLLHAIATSFATLNASALVHYERIKEEDARFLINTLDGKIRFERIYPIKIHAKGELFSAKEWTTEAPRNENSAPIDQNLKNIIDSEIKKIGTTAQVDFPILAFYRADRRWLIANVSAESAALERPSRLDGYKGWMDASANIDSFERWVISKTLERLQKLSESGASLSFEGDELDLVNTAIKNALPESAGIKYDMTLRSLVVNISSGKQLPFSSLSDGQRAMIALISDIARRICLLNPHFGIDALKKCTGLVIIDELDIHLHPAWQRQIVHALKASFPEVQFIASSHSPQIIGSLPPEEVIILQNGESSHPRVTYGLDSSSVLSEVMDVDSRDPEIQELLQGLFTSLENNELPEAKEKLKNLKNIAPDLPEFSGAEALIRRKEVLRK